MPIAQNLRAAAPDLAAASACVSPAIEAQLADTVLRIAPGIDEAMLTMVLRALPSSPA